MRTLVRFFYVHLQPFNAATRDAEDKKTIHVHVIKIPAQVLDDLLYLSVYRHHAVPVALYR